MHESHREIKEIAAQLLAGMLANPHIYAKVSDEEGRGQQEKNLIITAIEMAEELVKRIDERNL